MNITIAVLLVFAGMIEASSDNARLYRVSPESFRCGPNAAYLMLKIRRKDVRYDELLFDDLSRGVSVGDVKRLLEQHGIGATTLRCSVDDLSKLPVPFIMYTNGNPEASTLGHFYVVVNVANGRIEVLDALSGQTKLFRLDKITNIWQGVVVVARHETNLHYIAPLVLGGAALLFLLIAARRTKNVSRT